MRMSKLALAFIGICSVLSQYCMGQERFSGYKLSITTTEIKSYLLATNPKNKWRGDEKIKSKIGDNAFSSLVKIAQNDSNAIYQAEFSLNHFSNSVELNLKRKDSVLFTQSTLIEGKGSAHFTAKCASLFNTSNKTKFREALFKDIAARLEDDYKASLDNLGNITTPEGLWLRSDGRASMIFGIGDQKAKVRSYRWIDYHDDKLKELGSFSQIKKGYLQFRNPDSTSTHVIRMADPDVINVPITVGLQTSTFSHLRIWPEDGNWTSEGAGGLKKSGTGFLISTTGVMATNYHVVEKGDSISISLNGSTYEGAVIKKDQSNDLALIQLLGFESIESLPYKLSSQYRQGEEVFTLGFPKTKVMGVEVKYTTGEISSLSGLEDNNAVMQISVPIQPGNSGGPLFNGRSEVVGVTASTLSSLYSLVTDGTIPQNVNYAVKSDYLMLLGKNINRGDFKPSHQMSKPDQIDELKKNIGLILVY